MQLVDSSGPLVMPMTNGDLVPIAPVGCFSGVMQFLAWSIETKMAANHTGQLAQAGFVLREVHAATFSANSSGQYLFLAFQ